jgi:hypothetical protein
MHNYLFDHASAITLALNAAQISLISTISCLKHAQALMQIASTDSIPTLTGFHLFPQLPAEIRLQIRTYLLRQLRYRAHSGPHGALFERPGSREVLAMLHTCSESRLIAERRFAAVRLKYWINGHHHQPVAPRSIELSYFEWVDRSPGIDNST